MRNHIPGGPEMVNNNTILFQANTANTSFLQYAIFGGVNQYFSQVAQADNRLTTDMTVFGWFRFDNLVSNYGLISRWVTAGDQRCYRLIRTSGNILRFEISETGNSTTKTVDSTVAPVAGTWYFVMGVHELSGPRLHILVSNPSTNRLIKTTNAASIPASIFDSATSALEIGRSNSTDYLAGTITFTGVCSSSLSKLSDDRFSNLAFQVGRALHGYV